jgi:hypothetical protein
MAQQKSKHTTRGKQKGSIRREQSATTTSRPCSFEELYPIIAAWVSNGGWIEIGYEIQGGSFARALDDGGMVWEGKKRDRSIDEVLKEMEKGIRKWTGEN